VDYKRTGCLEESTVDRWPIVPNSYVNNDGKPNLNDSNAENENDARLAVWCTGAGLVHAFEPAANHTACFAQTCLDFEHICFVCKLEFKNGSQV